MANFIGMFMIFLELNAREVEEEHMVSKNVEICWGNLKTSFYKQFQMVYFWTGFFGFERESRFLKYLIGVNVQNSYDSIIQNNEFLY